MTLAASTLQNCRFNQVCLQMDFNRWQRYSYWLTVTLSGFLLILNLCPPHEPDYVLLFYIFHSSNYFFSLLPLLYYTFIFYFTMLLFYLIYHPFTLLLLLSHFSSLPCFSPSPPPLLYHALVTDASVLPAAFVQMAGNTHTHTHTHTHTLTHPPPINSQTAC